MRTPPIVGGVTLVEADSGKRVGTVSTVARTSIVNRPRTGAALAIVVVAGVGLHFLTSAWSTSSQLDASGDLRLTIASRWSLVVLAVAAVLLVERQPWTSLGTRRLTRTSWVWASALGAAQILQVFLPTAASQTGSVLGQLGRTDLILVLVTAALAEEAIFRGFLQERLIVLIGNRWLPAVLAGAAFLLVHVTGYGWSGAVIGVGLGAVSLSILYAVTRNTGLCALFHLALNAPIMIGLMVR